jgi:hypothetical protein
MNYLLDAITDAKDVLGDLPRIGDDGATIEEIEERRDKGEQDDEWAAVQYAWRILQEAQRKHRGNAGVDRQEKPHE